MRNDRKRAPAGRRRGPPPGARAALSELGRRTEAPPISWLMALTLSRPEVVSLAAGFTDNETLPVNATRALFDELLARPGRGRPALQYGTTLGDDRLREATADWVRRADGALEGAKAYAADRVLITNGSQQLLYLVAEALCDPGDIVLVEDPTYFVFLGITQSHGLICRGVPLEPDGLRVEDLAQVLDELAAAGQLPRVKLLYLVSYFQNPTGTTTSRLKKAAVLELLRRYERGAGHPIYLLEDAAYRELRFRGDDVVSALRLEGAGDRVIYAGTYSKPFATGVRVGFGFLPEPLFTVVVRLKGNHDFGTSTLVQKLIAGALRTGEYTRHVVGLRARYAAKADAMIHALEQAMGGQMHWRAPAGGLYVWASLPRRIQTGPKSAFFRKALDSGVLYVPGELCYADDATRARPACEMRLSFGGATLREIRIGVQRLGAALCAL